MTRFLILSLLLGAQPLRPSEVPNSLDRFSWLLGSWHIPGTESRYDEVWVRLNDSLYTGKGWAMAGEDTVFFESIELRYHAGVVDYTVRAREQKGEQTVDFRLVADSANTFVFENAAHDFPQRIIYRHPAPDSLAAYIEGTIDGKYRRSDFPMIRKE